MKKLALLATILFFSVAANAQTTAKEKKESSSTTEVVKQNNEVKLGNETEGKSGVKTADKNREALLKLVKGRENNHQENDPEIPKNKTIKKTEDPDQGGEIIKKKNVSVKKN